MKAKYTLKQSFYTSESGLFITIRPGSGDK